MVYSRKISFFLKSTGNHIICKLQKYVNFNFKYKQTRSKITRNLISLIAECSRATSNQRMIQKYIILEIDKAKKHKLFYFAVKFEINLTDSKNFQLK